MELLTTTCRANKKTFWISSLQSTDFIVRVYLFVLCSRTVQQVSPSSSWSRLDVKHYKANRKYYISLSSVYLWLICRAFYTCFSLQCQRFFFSVDSNTAPSAAFKETVLSFWRKTSMRRALPGRQQSALVAALLEHANAFSSPCPSAAHKTSHHSCSSQMHTDAFSLCICLSVPTCLPISLSSRTAGRCRSACSVIRCTFLAFLGNILTLFPRLELKSFKNRE